MAKAMVLFLTIRSIGCDVETMFLKALVTGIPEILNSFPMILGIHSPCILLSKNPPKTLGTSDRFLKRTMVEKNAWNQFAEEYLLLSLVGFKRTSSLLDIFHFLFFKFTPWPLAKWKLEPPEKRPRKPPPPPRDTSCAQALAACGRLRAWRAAAVLAAQSFQRDAVAQGPGAGRRSERPSDAEPSRAEPTGWSIARRNFGSRKEASFQWLKKLKILFF